MDLQKTAEQLIYKHQRKTEHLTLMQRSVARQHYVQAIKDCLAALQESAIEDDLRSRLSAPDPATCISGPLAEFSHTHRDEGEADEVQG